MTETGGGSGYLTPIMIRRAEGEQISSELERRRSVAVERKVRRRGIGNGFFLKGKGLIWIINMKIMERVVDRVY